MACFRQRRNFLDEFLWDLQWRRARGLWRDVINAERGAGVVREGNLLDWRFTRFPQVVLILPHTISRRITPLQTKSEKYLYVIPLRYALTINFLVVYGALA